MSWLYKLFCTSIVCLQKMSFGKSLFWVVTSSVMSQDYSGWECCGYYSKLRVTAVPTSFLLLNKEEAETGSSTSYFKEDGKCVPSHVEWKVTNVDKAESCTPTTPASPISLRDTFLAHCPWYNSLCYPHKLSMLGMIIQSLLVFYYIHNHF